MRKNAIFEKHFVPSFVYKTEIMFIVAQTDPSWFEYQKQNGFIDKVNFWSPNGASFKALKPGEQLVFKLKGTDDLAGGYGIFDEYKVLSIEDTWNEFGRRNGYDNKEDFSHVIIGHKNRKGENKCGCIVLRNVVYYDTPVRLRDCNVVFNPNTVRYTKYEGTFQLTKENDDDRKDFVLVSPIKKKKKAQNVTQREGQAQFHTAVSMAYHHTCCISGEKTPELLQAAHIQDYINRDSHHIQNGLLLRVDLHSLFDSGLLSIDDEYVVHISSLVRSDDYRKYDGRRITLPDDKSKWPSIDALKTKEASFRE